MELLLWKKEACLLLLRGKQDKRHGSTWLPQEKQDTPNEELQAICTHVVPHPLFGSSLVVLKWSKVSWNGRKRNSREAHQ